MKKLGLFLGFVTYAMVSVAQSTEQSALTLTLEQALEIALSESPTIKVAEQEIEIKRFAKQESYASLYPRFDATAQYQRVIEKQTMSMDMGDGNPRTLKVGSDNSFNGGLSASMPIVNAQLWESLKVSVADVMLAIEKARSSQIDMIEQVSQSYFTVLLAKESLAVYQRVYENAVENNKNIKRRYEVGSISEFDYISSNVSVQNAIPNLIEAENSVVLALWQLKALLGIDLKKNIDVAGSLKDYEAQMNYAQTLDQLDLSNNSTLKQLDIQEGMLESAVKISKWANLPTLSVNAAYLYTALGNDGKFFQGKAWNPYSYAGVQLNIPIFAGGQRRAAIKQSQLNLSNLKLQRENAERQLQVAVVQSLNNMQTNVKKFSSAAATVGQAQRGYEIAVKRYEVGSGTLVDIDNSQLALTQAELGRNSAIYNFLMAKISLDKILGKHEVKSNHDYIDRYESMYERRYGDK
ncbi:MAG: TolC family protein [Alistipes sp.]|nr:TolC family protein [Alistipes sp.]